MLSFRSSVPPEAVMAPATVGAPFTVPNPVTLLRLSTPPDCVSVPPDSVTSPAVPLPVNVELLATCHAGTVGERAAVHD